MGQFYLPGVACCFHRQRVSCDSSFRVLDRLHVCRVLSRHRGRIMPRRLPFIVACLTTHFCLCVDCGCSCVRKKKVELSSHAAREKACSIACCTLLSCVFCLFSYIHVQCFFSLRFSPLTWFSFFLVLLSWQEIFVCVCVCKQICISFLFYVDLWCNPSA